VLHRRSHVSNAAARLDVGRLTLTDAREERDVNRCTLFKTELEPAPESTGALEQCPTCKAVVPTYGIDVDLDAIESFDAWYDLDNIRRRSIAYEAEAAASTGKRARMLKRLSRELATIYLLRKYPNCEERTDEKKHA